MRNNVWVKILLVMIPLALVGLVTAIRSAEKIDTLEMAVGDRAMRETVAAQYESLRGEITALREDIRALRVELRQRD